MSALGVLLGVSAGVLGLLVANGVRAARCPACSRIHRTPVEESNEETRT